jgi:hypothetical protein
VPVQLLPRRASGAYPPAGVVVEEPPEGALLAEDGEVDEARIKLRLFALLITASILLL